MDDWILACLANSFVFLVLSVIASALGGCNVGIGEESWEDERYEKIYYRFLAPTSAVSILICIVLIIIKCAN